MSISSIYNKLSTFSPYIELFIRKIYWSNVKSLKKIKGAESYDGVSNNNSNIDFDKVITFVKEPLQHTEIMIIHSSWNSIKNSNLSPEVIINKLISLKEYITLAMPVIRKFKGEPEYENILHTNTDSLHCEYNVRKTPITSGMLPAFLIRRKDCLISRFPLNPLAAIGPHASAMMEHNLDGDYPSPHGPYSSWKYCMDHNAIIIGLGIDICHHITMAHTFEESFGWPIKPDIWYRKRRFTIIDKELKIDKIVHERLPKWGMLHEAEKTFARDLRASGYLHEQIIDGVSISYIFSQDLKSFLDKKKVKNPTYPYFLCKN